MSNPNCPNFNAHVGEFASSPFVQHFFQWPKGVLTDIDATKLPGENQHRGGR
jgi:hypothetical protein